MDLFTLIEHRKFHPFTERESRSIFIQLLHAVHHCHSNGVIHFDIKLDNIMVEPKSGVVTLIDFGLCGFTHNNDGWFTKQVGSEEYCAPELYNRGAPYKGTKVDIWCLGIVLYSLLCCNFPFNPLVKITFQFCLLLTVHFLEKKRNDAIYWTTSNCFHII